MKSKMKTILVLMFQQIHYVFGQLSFQTKKKKSFRMCSEFLKEDCPKISDIWLGPSLLYLWWAGSINKTTSSKFFNLFGFRKEFIRRGQLGSSHIVWPITLDIKVREDNEVSDDDVGERTWLRRRSFVTSMYMKWWYSKLTPRCSQRQWGWFSGWCVAGGWCRMDLRQACTTNMDE